MFVYLEVRVLHDTFLVPILMLVTGDQKNFFHYIGFSFSCIKLNAMSHCHFLSF